MCVWQKERRRSFGLQVQRAEKSPLPLKSQTGRAHTLQTDGSTQAQGKITGNALTHSENKRGVRVHLLPAATDVEVCVYLRPQTLSSVHGAQLSAGFVIVITEAHVVISNQSCIAANTAPQSLLLKFVKWWDQRHSRCLGCHSSSQPINGILHRLMPSKLSFHTHSY